MKTTMKRKRRKNRSLMAVFKTDAQKDTSHLEFMMGRMDRQVGIRRFSTIIDERFINA